MSTKSALALLRDAASLISTGTVEEIAEIWAIGEDFHASRQRALSSGPTRSARVYAGLQYGLIQVYKQREGLLDEALLCTYLLVGAGVEELTARELESAVATLFDPPLGRPEARSIFESTVRG
jgi:hypothetical protein